MTDSLVAELNAARAAFFAELDAVEPSRLNAPKLINDWSARELMAHLGYWAGHAAEVIHSVEGGRASEVGIGEPSVDERNETVARVARHADLATARKREAASVQALLERLVLLDPALLMVRLPDGATLEEGIREDGAIHYREHTDELRSAAGHP
ncbi:MAG: maleylpyruvate isomerase N-terminal domain-containing protein [Candidatus Limnocylindria bacterium]